MIFYFLYLDPGAGSYLVQAIIAAALGVAFFFRNIRLYITHWWYKLFKKKSKLP